MRRRRLGGCCLTGVVRRWPHRPRCRVGASSRRPGAVGYRFAVEPQPGVAQPQGPDGGGDRGRDVAARRQAADEQRHREHGQRQACATTPLERLVPEDHHRGGTAGRDHRHDPDDREQVGELDAGVLHPLVGEDRLEGLTGVERVQPRDAVPHEQDHEDRTDHDHPRGHRHLRGSIRGLGLLAHALHCTTRGQHEVHHRRPDGPEVSRNPSRGQDGGMSYEAAENRYDDATLPPHRTQRPAAAAALVGAVAELRQRPAGGHPARDPAPRLRPGRDALRPGQQLRPSVRPRGGELRALDARGLRAVPRRARDLDQGRLRHVARPLRPGRRLAEVRPRRRSTSRWLGWVWTYVDIFYSHRFDPDTPLEETIGALDTAVRSGTRAVRRHLVVLRREQTREAATIARELGTPLLIHQPSYSMLNRWIEGGPARRARGAGHGLHRLLARSRRVCSPTATSTACPATREPRATTPRSPGLEDDVLRRVRALNEIAQRRGQKLAQLALQWALRDRRVTSAVIGASSVEQLDTNLDALDASPLTDGELAEIDRTPSSPASTSGPTPPRSDAFRRVVTGAARASFLRLCADRACFGASVAPTRACFSSLARGADPAYRRRSGRSERRSELAREPSRRSRRGAAGDRSELARRAIGQTEE